MGERVFGGVNKMGGGPVGGLIKITMDSDFWGCLGVPVDGEADRSAGGGVGRWGAGERHAPPAAG